MDEIIDSLSDSEIFVLFISEASLQSEWVQKEMGVASRLHKHGIIQRIFPLIIDKGVNHTDSRIPEWIRRPYNIKPFSNEVLVLKKIRQFLREADIKNQTIIFKNYLNSILEDMGCCRSSKKIFIT